MQEDTEDRIIELLGDILSVLKYEGITVKREYSKVTYSTPLSQDDYDALDEEIDLDWWFAKYGEDVLPAGYMNQSGIEYSKKELDYLHKRLKEISSVSPEINEGTHLFKSVGKKYCKAEKNTLNCFQCVPIK